MDNFRFFTPTEVVFGKGVENQTGALAAKHGTRALIVYGKGSALSRADCWRALCSRSRTRA